MLRNFMNSIFIKHLGDFVLVFTDDIFTFSKSEDEHKEHLRKVFEILRLNRLFAKKRKCDFLKSHVKYLGHIMSEDGIFVDPRKIKAIAELASMVGKCYLGGCRFVYRC